MTLKQGDLVNWFHTRQDAIYPITYGGQLQIVEIYKLDDIPYPLALLECVACKVGFALALPMLEDANSWFWSSDGYHTGKLPISIEDHAIHPILEDCQRIPLNGYQMNDVELSLRQAYRAGVKNGLGMIGFYSGKETK